MNTPTPSTKRASRDEVARALFFEAELRHFQARTTPTAAPSLEAQADALNWARRLLNMTPEQLRAEPHLGS